MGHIIGKDIYKRLGKKIDNLTVRVPLNENFYNILKELYTPDEAEVIVKMPYSLSSFEKVARVTQKEEPRLQQILDSLCSKGLVVDLCTKRKNYYMPAPMIVGIFEMTMMRVGPDVNHKTCAKLFHEYLSEENNFYTANFGHGEKISIMRTLPHEETVADEDYVEFLDYEKATSIVEKSSKFSMGYCSCRHEKFHLGEKECEAPLDNCSSFGVGADYLIRHNMAKEVSKSEMLENIERSRELGLVLTADNVKRNVGFICHCCKCCCNVMTGINKHGYPNTIKTSTFISKIDESKCTACKKCVTACPINAIKMVPIEQPATRKLKNPRVDESICLGCGLCSLACNKEAVELVKRQQRVIHPETSYERVILQTLERGTLQNQIFDDPQKVTQRVMRGFIGGFLKLPPVKKALLSDLLRSSFLASMKKDTKKQGKGWLTRM